MLVPIDGINNYFMYQIDLNNLIIDSLILRNSNFEEQYKDKIIPYLIKDLDDIYDVKRIDQVKANIETKGYTLEELLAENQQLSLIIENTARERRYIAYYTFMAMKKSKNSDKNPTFS
jgi:hypothetical protein